MRLQLVLTLPLTFSLLLRQRKDTSPQGDIAQNGDRIGLPLVPLPIEHNYKQIKADVKQMVADEFERIKNDPNLAHLIKEQT